MSWNEYEQGLIADYRIRRDAGWLPKAPFELHPGVKVVYDVKFYERTEAGIEAGPDAPRAYTGALQHDLKRLVALADERNG